MTSFRLGFQTHVHGHAPARELLPGLVDLYVAAEELGFESGWVAQHHLRAENGRLPSPLVLLGAVAERTSRIRLGTSVIVLPLEQPVRLAEDAATVDAISEGRLELGLGTGGPSAAEFAAFGRDADERHGAYERAFVALVDLLAERTVVGGQRLSPSGAGILDRLWDSHYRQAEVAQSATHGRGLLLGIGPARSVQEPLAGLYRQHHRASHPNTPPRIAAFRGVFPGESRLERERTLAPDVQRMTEHLITSGTLRIGSTAAETLAALNVQYGTPDDIVASLRRDPVLPYASDLVLAVQAESTSIPDAIRNLEVIAAEIAPRLGWSAKRPVAKGTGGSSPAATSTRTEHAA
ncbi:LLM class flavin-dependent oxidoreductase [Plantibacter sp. YIM 135347]|uniref:LLM class flavin-dependent oxidoreductase n=1 Tax=Plantibacter sp. YIM 135347 TaxID=3423919 RepID=UPI003D32CBF9